MAEEIGFRLNVDEGNAKKSVRSFKQELRDAKAEAIEIGRNFGAFSPQAVEAAAKLGKLKDEMRDLNTLATNLTDEKRFSAFAGFAGSLAGGFTAAQGAITLVTGESKKFEAAMLKVQSAMALSQGLGQVAELGKTWGRASNALQSFTLVQKLNTAATAAAATVQKLFTGSVETTSVGFKVLKGAIIATGLGALAVAIGYLINNFDKIKEKILNLIPGLKSVADFFGKIIDAVTDFVGITSEAGRAADKLRDSIKGQNDAADKNIQLLEAAGVTSKKIRILKNLMYEDELNKLRQILSLAGKLSEDEQKRFKELKFNQLLLQSQKIKEDKDEAAAQKQKDAADAKTAAEKAKQKAKAAADAAKKAKEEETKKDNEIFSDYEAAQQKIIDAQKATDQYKVALLKAQGKDALEEREKQIDEEIQQLKESGGKFADGITALEREKVLIAAQAKTDAEAKQKKKDDEQAKKDKEVSDELKQAVLDNMEDGRAKDLQAIQDKYDAMKAIVKDNEELMTAITAAEAEARAKVTKKWDDATVAAKLDFVESVGSSLSQLTSLFGKQTQAAKGIAIAGIITEQAAAIGKIVINTNVANAKAIAASPLTLGQPFVTANTIQEVLGIAGSVAAGAKAIRDLGGGAAGASAPAPSVPNKGASPVVPVRPTMDGIQSTLLDKTNEIAAGKDAMKAYVVESEITEKQERQRAITNTANF